MPNDPYAGIATPVKDPYAGIAAPAHGPSGADPYASIASPVASAPVDLTNYTGGQQGTMQNGQFVPFAPGEKPDQYGRTRASMFPKGSQGSGALEIPDPAMQVGPVVHSGYQEDPYSGIAHKLDQQHNNPDTDYTMRPGIPGMLARTAVGAAGAVGLGEQPTPQGVLGKIAMPLVGELSPLVQAGIGEVFQAPETIKALREGDYPTALASVGIGALPLAGHAIGAAAKLPGKVADLAGAAKTALTEHPESGGGPLMDARRLVSDPLAETRQLAPKTYQAAHQLAEARNVVRLSTDFTHQGIQDAMGGTPEDLQRYYDLRDYDAAQGISRSYADAAQAIPKSPLALQNPEVSEPIRFQLQKVAGKMGIPDDVLERYDSLVAGGTKSGGSMQTIPIAKARQLAADTLTKAAELSRDNNAWTAKGGTPEDAVAIMASPEFQQAHSVWNSDYGLGTILNSSHVSNGGVITDRAGDLGYFPRIAVTEDGAPAHSTMAPRDVTINDQNRANNYATGLNDGGYNPTAETVPAHAGRLIRGNAEANMLNAARDEGLSIRLNTDADGKPTNDRWAIRPERNADGKLEFVNPGTGEVVNGELVNRGLRLTTQDGHTIQPPQDFAPRWFVKEIAPLLQRSGEEPTGLNQWTKAVAGMAITANPAEGVGHLTNILNGLESNRFTNRANNPVSYVLEHAPLPEVPVPLTGKTLSLNKAVDMAGLKAIDLTSAENKAKLVSMAQEGILGARAGETQAPNSVLGNLKAKTSDALNAVDLRARVAMYDDMKKFEAQTGTQLTHEQRFDAMRTFGNYTHGLETGLERGLKSSGLNIFATAHYQQVRNGFKQWATLMGIDSRYANLPTGQRIGYKIRSQLAGGPVKKALAWYLTSLIAKHVYQEAQQGDDKFGKVRGPGGSAQIASSLPRGEVGGIASGAYNAAQQGRSPVEGASVGLTNATLQDSGVAGGLGNTLFSSMTGKAPYMVPGKGRQGPQFVSTIPKGVPNNTATRLLYGITGMNSASKYATDHVMKAFGYGAE